MYPRRRAPSRPAPLRARNRLGVAGLTALFAIASPVAAQPAGGTTSSAVAGGVLGAYSGSLLSLIGSLAPCGQTMAGPTCSAWVTGVGGVVSAAGGALLGGADEEALEGRAQGAVIGALAGGAVGYVLKGVVRQYGWPDVAASAALGVAIGSSARGSAVGLAAGAITGGVLLASVPSVRVTDAVAVSLAGLALGGVLGWMGDGVQTQRERGAPVMLSISVRR